MTHLKRLVALIVFVAVAAATRIIVRYGVEGAFDLVSNLIYGDPAAKAKTGAPVKPKQKLVAQNAIPGSPPLGKQGAALTPAAPVGAGPIAAARNAAAAANSQLATQTGQQVPPPKGATPAPPPATQPAAVVQQGAPKTAAPPPAAKVVEAPPAGAKVVEAPPTPTSGAKPKTVEAPPAVPSVAAATLAPNARVATLDSAPPRVLRESFDYARDSRRDPFISLMTTNDLRPTLTDLKLTGILYDLAARRPVAVLRDVAGGQWRVTTGMTLGRMRVAQIKPKVIIFTIEEFGFNRQDSLVLGDTTRVRSR
jgi:hypothetical protein